VGGGLEVNKVICGANIIFSRLFRLFDWCVDLFETLLLFVRLGWEKKK